MGAQRGQAGHALLHGQEARQHAHVVADHPVGLDVAAHHPDQLAGNLGQDVLSLGRDRRLVQAHGVVERQRVLRKGRAEVTATVTLRDLLGHLDEFRDHLRGCELPVRVLVHQLLDPLGEGPLPDQAVTGRLGHLLGEQVTKRLDRQVRVLGLLRPQREVGTELGQRQLRDPRSVVDVDDLAGGRRACRGTRG